MSLIPSAPQSIGGVLDSGIRLYKESFLASIVLTSAVMILVTAMALVFFGSAIFTAKPDPTAVLALFKSPVTWLIYLVVVVIYIGFYNALIIKINSIARGETASIGTALAGGLRLAPRTILMGLFLCLILGIAFVLLIIPGIYVWGMLQFCIIAMVLENTGVFESMGTSQRLVKGYWWRSATIGFIALVLLMVFRFIGSFIGGILAAFTKDVVVTVIVSQGISMVISILTISLMPSILLITYYDLKLRHEGGDLSNRINAL